MATKLTKWTPGKKCDKDYADPVRRGHQKLPFKLQPLEGRQMKNLASTEDKDKTSRLEEKEVISSSEKDSKLYDQPWRRRIEFRESHDEAVLRKRLERLRAQLHSVNIQVKIFTQNVF